MILYQEDLITIGGGFSMPRIHILLVEDDENNAFAMASLLQYTEEFKYQVTVAESCQQAIKILQQPEINIDIILLDLNLPDSRGIATLKTISDLFPRMPVIVITGIREADIVTKTAREGAIHFMEKTEITRPALTNSIEFVIEKQAVINDLIDSRDQLRAAVDNLSQSSANIKAAVKTKDERR